MRVLQVMAGAEFGGAETYFVDMVTALHRAGLDQKAVIRRNPRRAAVLRDAGVDVVELAFGGPFDLGTGRQLARIIDAYRPDVVQSWMNRATRFVPQRRNRKSFVHVGWLGGFYKPGNFSACNHAIGVTPDIRDHLVQGGIPADRAHYIPTFAPLQDAAVIPRAEWGTPDDAPLFLALGRLHRKKAFDILIEAAARVPAAYVWIAGEGELRSELQNRIDRAGVADRVRLLGWRDDRGALLATADVCVMPSRYEPFGTVMIEAWAYGTPLIAAAARGPAGLIRDGEDGLLIPIDDVDALAQAMGRLIEDPALAGRLADGGRAVFEQRFTEAAVVRQYMAFYTRIASR